jgi:hypothetical protein
VGEVGILLHEQRAAPPRSHLFLHQRVLLDEVEGVVRQLQGTGVAMVAVPVVDALCAVRTGEESNQLGGRALELTTGVYRCPMDSPNQAEGWVLGQCSDSTSGLAPGTPCRDPQTPAESLSTGTHRLLTGPHHPCCSEGGTLKVSSGACLTSSHPTSEASSRKAGLSAMESQA